MQGKEVRTLNLTLYYSSLFVVSSSGINVACDVHSISIAIVCASFVGWGLAINLRGMGQYTFMGWGLALFSPLQTRPPHHIQFNCASSQMAQSLVSSLNRSHTFYW